MQRFTVLTSSLLGIQQPLLNISNIHNDYFQLIFNVNKPKTAPPKYKSRALKCPTASETLKLGFCLFYLQFLKSTTCLHFSISDNSGLGIEHNSTEVLPLTSFTFNC